MPQKVKTKRTLSITVRGIPWSLKFFTSKQMLKKYKETALFGLTDTGAQCIYVDYQQTLTTVLNTIFHELFHAWVATTQGSTESLNGAVSEETAANSVGDGLVELLPFLEEILRTANALALPKE